MSADSTNKCANHTCTTCVDTEEQDYRTCSLCKQPVYCSDTCRVIDWPLHACENVIHTNTLNERVAVPYYYEDQMEEEDLEQVPLSDPIYSSYVVRHTSPDRTVSEYVIPSLVEGVATSKRDPVAVGRGDNPAGDIVSYTMQIEVPGGVVGQINGMPNKDMIFKGVDDETAAELAKKRTKKENTRYSFWPHPSKVIDAFKRTTLPLKGTIQIWVTIAEKNGTQSTAWVAVGYELFSSSRTAAGKVKKKLYQQVKRVVQRQQAVQFKDTGISTKDVQVFRASDGDDGITAVLSFLVSPGKIPKAQLVDVEVLVEKTAFVPASSTAQGTAAPIATTSAKFTCDPRNVDEVVGLAMALDLVAPKQKDNKRLQVAAETVKQYAQDLLLSKTKEAKIPREVSAAIYTAVEELYEPQAQRYVQALRAGPQEAKRIASDLQMQLREADALTGVRKAAAPAMRLHVHNCAQQLREAIAQVGDEQCCCDEETKRLVESL